MLIISLIRKYWPKKKKVDPKEQHSRPELRVQTSHPKREENKDRSSRNTSLGLYSSNPLDREEEKQIPHDQSLRSGAMSNMSVFPPVPSHQFYHRDATGPISVQFQSQPPTSHPRNMYMRSPRSLKRINELFSQQDM